MGDRAKWSLLAILRKSTQMILRTTHLAIQALGQSVRCPHVLALRSRRASRIVPEWPLARLWTGSLSQNPPGVKWGSQTSPPLSGLLSTLNYPSKHVSRKHPQKSSTEVILLPTCVLGGNWKCACICRWRSGNTTAQGVEHKGTLSGHKALIILGGWGSEPSAHWHINESWRWVYLRFITLTFIYYCLFLYFFIIF